MTKSTIEIIHDLVGGAMSGTADGTNIVYDDGQTPPTESEIDAELIRQEKEYSDNEYARKRAEEYPSYATQLDEIFHNGIDSWKAVIQITKDKYPKPE